MENINCGEAYRLHELIIERKALIINNARAQCMVSRRLSRAGTRPLIS